MGNLFQLLLIQPMVNILVFLYYTLTLLHIPYAVAFSIILLTVIIRLILYPFTAAQLKASKKMQEINPHLSKLREKHKGDMQRLQQETMALYKEYGINPAAGCLPMIIQLPIIWALYAVLQKIVALKSINDINTLLYIKSFQLKTLWDTHFLGLPLGQGPSQLLPKLGILILLIPVITAVLQLLQSKMMFPASARPAKTENKKTEDDFATAFQTQSLYIFPLMIGFLAYRFPIGLSLYWNTFTIFGIIQQYRIQGLGGLAEWFKKPAQKSLQERVYGKHK